jgi:Flp pilus assembly protein TadG
MRQITRYVLEGDDGSNIVELALLLPVLLLMLVAAVDFGRAYYIAIEVNSAAHAGALYGSQNPTDTNGMITAARLDAADVPLQPPSATYDCECYDGTAIACGATADSCSNTGNPVYRVTVKTSAIYTPMLNVLGVIDTLTINGQSIMRAAY